jgi:hypothetical protein
VIAFGQSQLMVSDGQVEDSEVFIAQVNHAPPQGHNKVGSALSMSGVAPIILAATVMQKSE